MTMNGEAMSGTETRTDQAATQKRSLPPLMQLSDAAAERLRALYDGGEKGKLLRIAVGAKGCSGMSYEMEWVEQQGPTDERVTDKGVSVLIDRKATLFLIGTIMDYRTDKFSSGFVFENPNEKGRCGCGESFYV